MIIEKPIMKYWHHENYYDNSDDSKNTSIIVDFISHTDISSIEKLRLKVALNEYLRKDRSDDIVEVTENIKGILKDLPETRLYISIESPHGDYIQEVTYINGSLDKCRFAKKDWDDILVVSNDYEGTRIQYKKRQQYIINDKDIAAIQNEIDIFMEKMSKLYGLEKKEEQHKTRVMK